MIDKRASWKSTVSIQFNRIEAGVRDYVGCFMARATQVTLPSQSAYRAKAC